MDALAGCKDASSSHWAPSPGAQPLPQQPMEQRRLYYFSIIRPHSNDHHIIIIIIIINNNKQCTFVHVTMGYAQGSADSNPEVLFSGPHERTHKLCFINVTTTMILFPSSRK
jgi:hypothetical protein